MQQQFAQRLMSVLWPSFLVAAAAELFVFSAIDPVDLHVFGVLLDVHRVPVYTLGFFFFWAIAAIASALTLLLQRGPHVAQRTAVDENGDA